MCRAYCSFRDWVLACCISTFPPNSQVQTIAKLLACTPDAVGKALCFRVVGNKLGAVEKRHTAEQAVYGRDAFAKVGTIWHLWIDL